MNENVRIISYSALMRPENMKLTHTIPLGSIVEVDVDMDNGWGPYEIVKRPGFGEYGEVIIGIIGKLRMFVVSHDRDCDGTPLYSIASSPIIPSKEQGIEMMRYHYFVRFYMSGINGDNMVVIPVAPEKIKSWDEFKNELVA
jgi:hypothetical protein